MKLRILLLCCAAAGLVAAQDLTTKQVQEILKSKGYYSGEIDGVKGSETEAAITAFQKAQGLKPTGEVDAKTAKQLQASMPKEMYGSLKGAGKDAASAGSETKGAGKEVGSSVKSESKGAWSEIKSVFKSPKKTETPPKPPDKQ